jgi:hypothetical protein
MQALFQKNRKKFLKNLKILCLMREYTRCDAAGVRRPGQPDRLKTGRTGRRSVPQTLHMRRLPLVLPNPEGVNASALAAGGSVRNR